MEWTRPYIVTLLIFFFSLAGTASAVEYEITYMINIESDGAAVWDVEYRTNLVTEEDFDSFENYTEQLNSVYLNEFKELMQTSVSEAAEITSRRMIAGDFTGDAAVQLSPTGTYGVIRYTFIWTNFADAGEQIVIGDAFAGGLYLSRNDALIINYPSGYEVDQVRPEPDIMRDGIVWYGLRSFRAGEPRIVLSRTSFSWMPFVTAAIVIPAVALLIYFFKVRRKKVMEIKVPEMMDLEERIIKLLKDSGGSQFQSEIVRTLGLPKSTVSSTLNILHKKNKIEKIKKGRENLIRLK